MSLEPQEIPGSKRGVLDWVRGSITYTSGVAALSIASILAPQGSTQESSAQTTLTIAKGAGDTTPPMQAKQAFAEHTSFADVKSNLGWETFRPLTGEELRDHIQKLSHNLYAVRAASDHRLKKHLKEHRDPDDVRLIQKTLPRALDLEQFRRLEKLQQKGKEYLVDGILANLPPLSYGNEPWAYVEKDCDLPQSLRDTHNVTWNGTGYGSQVVARYVANVRPKVTVDKAYDYTAWRYAAIDLERDLIAHLVEAALSKQNAQEELWKIPPLILETRRKRVDAEETWRSTQRSTNYPSLLSQKSMSQFLR